MKYRCLDHTSDLGLEIFGKDLPELFRNAGLAMFDNIVDLSQVAARESRHIELHSASRDELFLDWLRELLFRFASEYFVVREVSSAQVRKSSSTQEPGFDEWLLSADVRGEKFDPARHRVKIEIKTPTYHMFSITEDAGGYKTTVVFDV